MREKPTYLAFGATLLLLLAGCYGKATTLDAQTAAASAAVAPTTAEVDEETCGLEGFVMDDGLEGVPNALVVIENTPFSTLTDPEGHFAFGKLPPKTYRLSTHPQGYEAAALSVACPTGEVVDDLVLPLKGIPNFGLEYHTTYPMRGKYGCGLGFSSIGTADFCRSQKVGTYSTPPLIPEANNTLFFWQDRFGNVTGALYELKWTKSWMFGSEWLLFNFASPNTGSPRTACPDTYLYHLENVGQAWGKSRACVRLDPAPKSGSVYGIYSGPIERRVEVRPSGNYTLTPTFTDRSSKVLIDQPFEFAVTLWYNGARVPEDWSYFE